MLMWLSHEMSLMYLVISYVALRFVAAVATQMHEDNAPASWLGIPRGSAYGLVANTTKLAHRLVLLAGALSIVLNVVRFARGG